MDMNMKGLDYIHPKTRKTPLHIVMERNPVS